MKLNACARVLLGGAMSIAALAGGTGVAHAQPDINPPPVPSPIDQLLTGSPALPALFVDPADEGGPASGWGGVGMYCENLFVQCQ